MVIRMPALLSAFSLLALITDWLLARPAERRITCPLLQETDG
jgi:hypothetical protein